MWLLSYNPVLWGPYAVQCCKVLSGYHIRQQAVSWSLATTASSKWPRLHASGASTSLSFSLQVSECSEQMNLSLCRCPHSKEEFDTEDLLQDWRHNPKLCWNGGPTPYPVLLRHAGEPSHEVPWICTCCMAGAAPRKPHDSHRSPTPSLGRPTPCQKKRPPSCPPSSQNRP